MSTSYENDLNGSQEQSPALATRGFVKVRHGANEGVFEVAGETVSTVQESLADAFNIPIMAFAFINGKIVGEEFRLRPNDDLSFSLLDGVKGANDKPSDGGFRGIKTPFTYFGGKTRVAPEVWRRFGDVRNYVEPFFGGGAVLLNRPVRGLNRFETVNDIDFLLVNFWRSLQQHPKKLANAANYPVSELDLYARHSWLVSQRDKIVEEFREDERFCKPVLAAWWVWGISQWIGGGWCAATNPRLWHQRPALNGEGVHRRNHSLPDHYLQLAERLREVRILYGDWSRLVTPAVTTKLGITGVFLDPPYTLESGRKKNLYSHDDLEIGHQVRDWAVQNGDNPKLRIALCGYEEEYRMPRNWSVYEWRAVGSKNGRKERIWFSPHCLK